MGSDGAKVAIATSKTCFYDKGKTGRLKVAAGCDVIHAEQCRRWFVAQDLMTRTKSPLNKVGSEARFLQPLGDNAYLAFSYVVRT
ncbi:hypothetical protein RCH09_001108 [Actimicrobium sp. GrIS 1.19]|nr:hypothetical protein [Actimicrobium sp. GrIS 1.19]